MGPAGVHILDGELRVVLQYLLDGHVLGEQPGDGGHGYAGAADARHPAHRYGQGLKLTVDRPVADVDCRGWWPAVRYVPEMDEVETLKRAREEYRSRLMEVQAAWQWASPTPCDEWNGVAST